MSAEIRKKSTATSTSTSMPTSSSIPHVVVVVLGDVGRSPRMQYHTRSLLEQGYYVSLVGYHGEDLIPDLQQQAQQQHSEDRLDRLNIVRFTPYCPPTWLKEYKFRGKIPVGLPVYLFIRLIGLFLGLVYALWFRVPVRKSNSNSNSNEAPSTQKSMPPVSCILVQNPPSIPLLLISYLYCVTHAKMTKIIDSTTPIAHTTTTTTTSGNNDKMLKKKKQKLVRPGFIIDWHNLGYTMFDTSPNHPIRKIAKLYEQMLAPLSDGNLCVTNAMKEFLTLHFHVRDDDSKIKVVYDRPPEFFHLTSLQTKHELMMKLRSEMESSCPVLKEMRKRLEYELDGEEEESTLFTKSVTRNGTKVIIAQENQPILLISSTSWTPDEDFSILLDALVELDSKIKGINEKSDIPTSQFPHFMVVVTGKGPQKAMYKAKIKELNLTNVSILTMWLEAEDYPILLGCADLGISLHLSTSNLDLPMKIYDFFGCELPVCAVGFPCLHELVQDDENGRIFDTSSELSLQLFDLCCGKEREGDENKKLKGDLSRYRSNIRGISRWRENWVSNAHEIIKASFPNYHSYGENYGNDRKAKTE